MLEEIEKNIDYGDVYDKKADIVELLNIINKAIEYIEENKPICLKREEKELLKILKGEDNE